MKKVGYILSICIIVLLIVVIFIIRLFDAQYNLITGLSSNINVELDSIKQKEKLGVSKGYTIYVEGINVDKSYFTTIFSNKISLRKAVKKKKVSVKDFKRKCISSVKEKNKTILKFENYEIVVENKKCLIRPLTTD